MRSEGSPLDLNHLPEDFTRDGKHGYEDISTSGQRRKKNQEDNKVYECRFCSLKFCKSQALGGHMNRHRQERETETLNKARQLVYTSDHNPHSSHLGSYVAPSAIYQHNPNPLQVPAPPPPVYPTRPVMLSTTAPSRQPPQYRHHSPCLYTSPPPPRMLQSTGDYYMAHGHALTGSSSTNNDHQFGTNYTCIGAPVSLPGLGPGPQDGLDPDDRITTPY